MAPATKLEKDAVRVDPKHYTVDAEMDGARVVRIRYGPREKSVMHQHPPGAVVALTDTHSRFTFPDGRVEEVRLKRGETLCFEESWEHNPENLADAPFEAIYVELPS
jgi:hypothetical protein